MNYRDKLIELATYQKELLKFIREQELIVTPSQLRELCTEVTEIGERIHYIEGLHSTVLTYGTYFIVTKKSSSMNMEAYAVKTRRKPKKLVTPQIKSTWKRFQ